MPYNKSYITKHAQQNHRSNSIIIATTNHILRKHTFTNQQPAQKKPILLKYRSNEVQIPSHKLMITLTFKQTANKESSENYSILS